MSAPAIGHKVYFAARKGPLHVIGKTRLNGELAVKLTNDWQAFRDYERGYTKILAPIVAVVPVADLVMEAKAGTWREKWQQVELPLGDAPKGHEDAS